MEHVSTPRTEQWLYKIEEDIVLIGFHNCRILDTVTKSMSISLLKFRSLKQSEETVIDGIFHVRSIILQCFQIYNILL